MYEQFSNTHVDEFMAITGADGSEANFYLKLHHNNLEAALQDFFEDPTKAHKNMKRTTLLDQYKEFKNQQDKRSCIVRNIDVRGKKLIEDVKILWKQIIPSIIRGATPGEEFLIEIGGEMKNIHFQEGTFDQSIRIAYQVQRPLLLLVYTPQLKGRLNELLPEEVKTYIADRFIVLGLLSSNEQFAKSLKQVSHQPSLLVYRTNFINQVQLISECDIKLQTLSADILSFLKRSVDSIQQEEAIESDIKREVRLEEQDHYDDDHHQNVLMEPEESREAFDRDYELQREIKRIQQQEFRVMKQQHQRKQSEQLEEILQGKMNQQKLEQLQQDRKARKMSLPQEPSTGSIITFNFKLPMGGRLLRSFDKTDKVELIYNFIELEDKIEFENEMDRKFDLLTMNPQTSLNSRRNLNIEEVFGDERQEVLLIKQL